MKPERPRGQEPATRSYLEPDKSSTRLPSYYYKICSHSKCQISLLWARASRKWKTFAWFHVSAAVLTRSAFFWDFTQRWLLVSYRRFGTSYRSHLQGPTWVHEVVTDSLSQNVSSYLTIYAT